MRKRKESLNFYSLLIRQMTVIRDAVAALCDYCEEPSQEKGDFVKIKEKEADAVRRELVEDINRTFITPIDREDLFRLSSSVDDLADYAWTTVKELRIYDIAPDEHLLRMARTLLDMAGGLLVDRVFQPLMDASDPAGTLARLFGRDAGAAAALTFFALGVAGVLVCLIFNRLLRGYVWRDAGCARAPSD